MPRPIYRTAHLLPTKDNTNLALPLRLDFTTMGLVAYDLLETLQAGEMNFIQSVFIDNIDNAAPLILTVISNAPPFQRIVAQPYTQGWYPITFPLNSAQFTAQTSEGQTVDVIFCNHAMPYFTYGAVPGVLIVPPLTNPVVNYAAAGPSDHVLVAGALGKTTKLYRAIINIDAPTTLTITDGAGGAVLIGPFFLTTGGSFTLAPSGIPWLTGSVNTDLVLHATAAANVGGGIGYVQS
jgi:hypothetical protein